jgi:hypothetical protein
VCQPAVMSGPSLEEGLLTLLAGPRACRSWSSDAPDMRDFGPVSSVLSAKGFHLTAKVILPASYAEVGARGLMQISAGDRLLG